MSQYEPAPIVRVALVAAIVYGLYRAWLWFVP